MQESGCYEDLDEGILLTGSGCQVAGIEVLLSKLSGHSVGFAKVTSVKDVYKRQENRGEMFKEKVKSLK